MKKIEQSYYAFKNEMESLQSEFEAYLSKMFSARTVRKHAHVIGLFIDFVCFDLAIQRIQDITKEIAGRDFRRWYKRKVGDLTEQEVKASITKFFNFLASEKKIVNEAVLTSHKSKVKRKEFKPPPKLDDKYPYLSEWIMSGWVEIGQSDEYRSMAKAFDAGGQVFEGGNKRKIKSLEDALNSLELGIKKWCDENGIDLLDES